MSNENTYDFIPTFRKVKNKQEYKFSLLVLVNGEFKTRYHGKDCLSKLNNRLQENEYKECFIGDSNEN